jgi:hypothetical protein
MVEIVDFLNNVSTKNYVDAEKQFNELLNDKLTSRLSDEKVRVADKIFNGAVEDKVSDDETEEVELSSEEETEVEDENI